jgi:hypothetical protein
MQLTEIMVSSDSLKGSCAWFFTINGEESNDASSIALPQPHSERIQSPAPNADP